MKHILLYSKNVNLSKDLSAFAIMCPVDSGEDHVSCGIGGHFFFKILKLLILNRLC